MLNLSFTKWSSALAAVTAAGATAVLVACGGGGGDATPEAVTPAAATTYSQGAITGFGSIFVGGVRFDDSTASVTDEDGNSRTRAELKLGMMVELDAGAVDRTAASALALRIRLGNEIVGPVGAVNTAASTVQVLGQTVLVTSSTIFDETLSGGLSALVSGAVVEVYGILDPANGRVVATRIEPKTGATAYKLRGALAGLNTTAKTFTINGQTISYASLPAANLPPGLANGQIVRVLLQTTQVSGAWVATALRGGLRLPEVTRRDAHVEGVISAFTSTSSFQINGLQVDASNATFPDGTAGIVLGAKVEVEGVVTNGVLVASKVEIENRRPELKVLELRGQMGNLNTTDKTFALRGVTVWYGGTVEYRNGTEATLANAKAVEVKGVLSTDRTRLEARRIEFK